MSVKKESAMDNPVEQSERPEIPDNVTPSIYFNELIVDRINKSSIPKIKSLNILVEFHITDMEDGKWGLVIESGMAKEVIHAKEEAVDPYPKKTTCTFKMAGATFLAIAKKELKPQKAFFTRKVEVKGNMFLALKANVLVSYL